MRIYKIKKEKINNQSNNSNLVLSMFPNNYFCVFFNKYGKMVESFSMGLFGYKKSKRKSIYVFKKIMNDFFVKWGSFGKVNIIINCYNFNNILVIMKILQMNKKLIDTVYVRGFYSYNGSLKKKEGR
uniref:Ribosomal protein S11 n=1 Tax=Acavomonas peruviana TaxID=1542312 RepID=V5KVI1_9ALVE|nr:ribosomal protein S11 [Acavomonas peruviana]